MIKNQKNLTFRFDLFQRPKFPVQSFPYIGRIDPNSELFPNKVSIHWQDPSFREKDILFWESLPHFVKMPRQIAFPMDIVHAWEMIHFLVNFQISHFFDMEAL